MPIIVYLAISNKSYGGRSACQSCGRPGFALRVFSNRTAAEEYVEEYFDKYFDKSKDKCSECEVSVIVLEQLVY